MRSQRRASRTDGGRHQDARDGSAAKTAKRTCSDIACGARSRNAPLLVSAEKLFDPFRFGNERRTAADCGPPPCFALWRSTTADCLRSPEPDSAFSDRLHPTPLCVPRATSQGDVRKDARPRAWPLRSVLFRRSANCGDRPNAIRPQTREIRFAPFADCHEAMLYLSGDKSCYVQSRLNAVSRWRVNPRH
jgi:hypothetical protein